MPDYVVHDASGRILRYGGCPEDQVSAQAGAGELAIEGSGGDMSHYVTGGVITPKTPSAATLDKTSVTADGVDTATISNISPPAFVWIGNEMIGETSDSSVELTFDTPGEYVIRLDEVEHFLKEFTINAN